MLQAAVVAAAEGETPNVLGVPVDVLILGIVAFFIVFFALWKLALPSIQRTLKDRTDAIEGGIQRAADAEEEARAMYTKYREKLDGAQEEAAAIRAKAEADARTILAEARAQAESELAAERAQTVAALRSDVGGLAMDLAGRIVGESLQDDDRARAVVDRFIAELEQSSAKEPS